MKTGLYDLRQAHRGWFNSLRNFLLIPNKGDATLFQTEHTFIVHDFLSIQCY